MPVRLQIAYALIGLMVLAGGWLIVAFKRNQKAKIDKYKSDNRPDR